MGILSAYIFFELQAQQTIKWCDYEPKKSVLRGTLIKEFFYTNPGYGETPEIDRIEEPLILVLDEPLAMRASERHIKNPDVLEEEIKGITRVHISGPSYGSMIYRFLNKKIECEGTLWQGHTGHHHAPVLMTLERFRATSHGFLAFIFRKLSWIDAKSN